MYIKYWLLNSTTIRMIIPQLMDCLGNDTNINNYFTIFGLDNDLLLSRTGITITELKSFLINGGYTLDFTINPVDYEAKKQQQLELTFIEVDDLSITREEFIIYLNN